MSTEPAHPLATRKGEVPQTLARALDPDWLSQALAPVTGGAPVTQVATVEVIRTMATKVRFTVNVGGRIDGFCLKAFLDVDPENARGGAVSIKEADFYAELAPHVGVRVPQCVAAIVDREAQFGVIIMRDLIRDGTRFCTALEPFTRDEAAQSLEQLARLHASHSVLQRTPWVGRKIDDFAHRGHLPLATVQQLLDGPRGEGLPARTRDASLLFAGLKVLAERDTNEHQVLVHGDCHAGNIFRSAQGAGLIDWQLLQRGGWALDIAYHISAVLPVDLAEKEERGLLHHYLDTMRNLGSDIPGREAAWEQYRMSVVYGYYLWSITRRVDPAITNVFVNRLGSAVTRHESYRMLGV
jgi:aminoglycoside phosphotransferase (APT) family kinase protein